MTFTPHHSTIILNPSLKPHTSGTWTTILSPAISPQPTCKITSLEFHLPPIIDLQKHATSTIIPRGKPQKRQTQQSSSSVSSVCGRRVSISALGYLLIGVHCDLPFPNPHNQSFKTLKKNFSLRPPIAGKFRLRRLFK